MRQIDEAMLGSNFDLDGDDADRYLRTMARVLTARGIECEAITDSYNGALYDDQEIPKSEWWAAIDAADAEAAADGLTPWNC